MDAPAPLCPADIDLGLYVHVPWCVRKCPYCDFNSHALRGEIPEAAFVSALLEDLSHDLTETANRPIRSIFIGGGTPSLLSGKAVGRLLAGIRGRADLAPDLEVTLEANPGALDASRFEAYREAGVNRLSIGVQSFTAQSLVRLGRIHDPDQACTAVELARGAGFDNINLDLMFGLPGQSLKQAENDLARAVDARPEHLSYYQLTLEPNTVFGHSPPPLPDDDTIWEMQVQGQDTLERQGYARYEVSAYARAGRRCVHNLNYWRFGDYIGIGPGAHGKLTLPHRRIRRTSKHRHPDAYLAAAGGGAYTSSEHLLQAPDIAVEFLLNALRLKQGFTPGLFESRTGLPFGVLDSFVGSAVARGLLETDGDQIRPSGRGYDFLNELLAMFDEKALAIGS